MKTILVFLEHDENGVSDLSLQALALARSLGGTVEALLTGEGLGDQARTALEHGAAQVWTVEHPALRAYLAGPTARVVAQVVKERGADLVLFPSSTVGNDLAPLVAGLLDAPCLVECDGVEATVAGWRMRRTEFDAQARAVYEPVGGGPVLATLKDGVTESAPASAGGTAAALAADPGPAAGEVLRREVAAKTVNLKDARVIVGGGAGVGSKEAFAQLETLATKLGGEIGATRASVDAGWVSAERQIGQTGVTVRPDLYIAVGISGAVQHLVGIRDAKTVVSINSDPSAPIFRVSHYRVVGDLNSIVPKLIELLG
jgi:electron transfer flavoprotein alpha subunit